VVMVNASIDTPKLSKLEWVIRPTSDYSFEELAEIFNATRIDYIVPMPMNGRRMEDYVTDYDVDLENSIVVLDSEKQFAGMGMIAFRDKRAWLTRLGVVPHFRQHKLGHKIMGELVKRAFARAANHVQLEVIVGNEPAKRLFIKHGFMINRELAILNRPPATVTTYDANYLVTPLEGDDLYGCLNSRQYSTPSWIDEAPSLIKSNAIAGFKAVHQDGSTGWVVFRKSRFQLSHFAVDLPPTHSYMMLIALFSTLHRTYPSLDAKLENFPADTPELGALRKLGYIEVFRRIEMHLDLI
jgi:ribosomal protein S18 acetylase RimI-like enzyme